MRMFSELYGVYYQTVAAILQAALEAPLKEEERRRLVEERAFGESALTILPALKEGRWPLLTKEGKAVVKHPPQLPLTTLEKRWLKAIGQDPRIRLFTDEIFDFSDVEPLFLPEDVCVFDRHLDGDPYTEEAYVGRFRLILDAIEKRYPLEIVMKNRNGNVLRRVMLPKRLEYSNKEDKFRLLGTGNRFATILNLGRILSCRAFDGPFSVGKKEQKPLPCCQVVFTLIDKRKALERVLIHFSHFQKEVEKLEENKYQVTLFFPKGEETELLIRLLSFGPMVRVVAPDSFVLMMKERLLAQKSCERR